MGLIFEVKIFAFLYYGPFTYKIYIGMLLSLGAWPMHSGVRDALCLATTVSIDQQVAVRIQKGNTACTRAPKQAPRVDTVHLLCKHYYSATFSFRLYRSPKYYKHVICIVLE